MNLLVIEKLEMLEWLDDFIKKRMAIIEKYPLPDYEILNIYKEQLEWNKIQRLKLARTILRV